MFHQRCASKCVGEAVAAIECFEQCDDPIPVVDAVTGVVTIQGKTGDGRILVARVVPYERSVASERHTMLVSSAVGAGAVIAIADLGERAGLLKANYFHFAPFLAFGIMLFVAVEVVARIARKALR